MKHLVKHQVSLSKVLMEINRGNSGWIALDTSHVLLDCDRLSQMLSVLQEWLPGGELRMEAESIHFASGQRLMDYVRDTRETINANEIEQA
jgi:hypothetical protein